MVGVLQWIAFLPLIFGQAAETSAAMATWNWPGRGYGIGWQYAGVPTIDLRGWHYNWLPDCEDPLHVPMIWDASLEAVAGGCNDGRPVLVLNEPERADQANTPPDRAADLLYRVAARWTGEVWCCGTDVSAITYALAVIDSYTARYGPWPAAGWHVHAYANGTLARDGRGRIASAEEFESLVAPWRAEATLRQVDGFAAALRTRGVLGRGVILSEYGALSNMHWHHPKDLIGLYQAFQVGIARRPYIMSAAWYSAYDWRFDASNLVDVDGRLTPLGVVAQRVR